MPYALGIDVGTSHTAAAVCRLDGYGSAECDVQAVRLGERCSTVESVLWLSGDGSVVVGETAAERAIVEHRRIARGFTARIGDDVPVVIGGEQYLPHELAAALVGWVIDRVEAQQGGSPEHTVVTHPASWGSYRCGVLHQALRRVGLVNVTLLPRPVAAAESHAALAPVDAGGLLAVYHLGGETFEAAVVRRLDSGAFGLLGHLEGDIGVDVVGGACFDDALAEQLLAEAGRPLDDRDPQERLAAWRLRQECAAAKERLSVAAEATVAARSGGPQGHVRVTRAQFEELIGPGVQGTVQGLLQCVRSVGVRPEQLAAVVLVGGSSRIPMVGRLITAGVPCGVAVGADPEITAARGAALVARRLLPGATPAVSIPQQRASETVRGDVHARGLGYDLDSQSEDSQSEDSQNGSDARYEPDARGYDQEAGRDQEAGYDPDFDYGYDEDFDLVPPPRPPVKVSPLELPERRSAAQLVGGVRPVVLGAVVTVVMVLGVGWTVLFGGERSPGSPASPDPGRARPVQTVSTSLPPTVPPTAAVTEQVTRPSGTSQDEAGR